MSKESDVLKKMKTAAKLEKEGRITSPKNTNFTTKDQKAIREITKSLTKQAKVELAKNPNIGRPALKKLLTIGKGNLALTAVAAAITAAYNSLPVSAAYKSKESKARRADQSRIQEATRDPETSKKAKEAFTKAGSGHRGRAASRKVIKEKAADMYESRTNFKGGGNVKNYTGGKSGDKYYGGGPVYPRPTKGD